ncbi:MAG: RDD family protein [Arenimonas sp.]|nr:RDD family protein [Arenimonas sp.]
MNAPAGFWRRYAAYSVDALALCLVALPLLWPRLRAAPARLLGDLEPLQHRTWELMDTALGSTGNPYAAVLAWPSDPALQAGVAALTRQVLALSLVVTATLFVLAAVWFIASESSRWQASPGKRLLGLRVTTLDGGRCGPGRAALRFFAGIASWALLNLGHAMAGWNPGKRALHDFIAGTRVELAPGAPAAMPAAARAWLLLQAAVAAGTLAWLLLRYLQLLQDAVAAGL